MADWDVGRLLVEASSSSSGGSQPVEDEDEVDVPEEIESVLEGLFKGLQDRVSFSTHFHGLAFL